MQALPHTMHSPSLLGLLLLDLMSTKNQNAILRRILGGCNGKLSIVEVRGSRLEDLSGRNVYERDMIDVNIFAVTHVRIGSFTRHMCLFSATIDMIHMKQM